MRPHAVGLVLSLLLAGCATAHQSARPGGWRSPLELRQAQTRGFPDVEPRLVLKAAINVLQDEGYTIREANEELGIVTAVIEWRSGEPHRALRVLKWVAVIPTYGASLLIPTGRTEFSSLEANLNVTPETGGTRVRISLVSRVVDKDGALRRVGPIDDPAVYQILLARLDRAVYLQREGL